MALYITENGTVLANDCIHLLGSHRLTILATSYGLSVPQIEDPQMIDLDKLFEQIGLNYSEDKQKQIPRMDYGLLDD